MKNFSLFSLRPTGVVCKILISIFLLLQVNVVLPQTPEAFVRSVEKPVTDKHSDDCVLPPGWDIVTTPSVLIIIIQNAAATINGVRVNTCDCVGCFYKDDSGELKCGGADFFMVGQSIVFPVFGDDPVTPEKDGFAYGDTIRFKIFSWSCAGGRSIDVDSIVFDTVNYQTTFKWYPLGMSAITYMACWTDFDCQISATNPEGKNINLGFQKGWNTFTYPGNGPDIENLVSQFGGRLVVIKESKGSGIIWPEKGIYTLDGLIRGRDYSVLVSEDCEIVVPK